jgi:hypothetical protein
MQGVSTSGSRNYSHTDPETERAALDNLPEVTAK